MKVKIEIIDLNNHIKAEKGNDYWKTKYSICNAITEVLND